MNKYSNKDLLQDIYIEEYKKNKTNIKNYNVTLSQYSKELLKINNKLEILYNDKLNNVISVDMYKKYSTSLKEEQKKLEVKTNNIKNLINKKYFYRVMVTITIAMIIFLIGMMISSPAVLCSLSTSSLMAINRTPKDGKIISRYFPVSIYSRPSLDKSFTITQLTLPD